MTKSDVQMARKLAHGAAKLGLEAKNSLYEIFHENTKLGPLTGRAYAAWIVNFTRSHRTQQIIEQGYKVYTLMERRELPRVEPGNQLERAIVERRSIRRFSGAPIRVDELARLLFFTYGRTDARGLGRAVASGGGLYPLELYVVAFDVEGLEPGVYHYGVEHAGLDVVRLGDARAEYRQVVNCDGVDADNASAAVVVAASFRRNTVKYRDRGYRMVLMEAGQAAQSIGLLATSMGLGACLLGGFNDDPLGDFLGIDGVDEAPLLPVLVGRPAPVADPSLPMPYPSAVGR